LQDNGGPTFIHLPAPDSPAIDAGDPARGWISVALVFNGSRMVELILGAAEVQAASNANTNANTNAEASRETLRRAETRSSGKQQADGRDSALRCPCVCTDGLINCKPSKIAVCAENLAGFDRGFRFTYQKHICAALKDERRADSNTENPTIKRKTFMKNQKIMLTSVLLALACFAVSRTTATGKAGADAHPNTTATPRTR
jgi:hypothetical protein